MLSVVGGAAGNGVKGNSRINMIYVFNRDGCIFYREWYRPNPPNTDDHKLMFGLVFSLRSFTAKMDPINGASGDGCSFHAFRTNTYKLNYLETPSGIKIILVTDPKMSDLRDALRHIYTNIYVEYVIKNPLYVPGEPFRCELFISNLDTYVTTLS
ncbi:hypothetical protein CLOM_g2960 [Closterium sp. NIES-68]|nr:hypothetical protein CLOM_g16771 [Closterium sp. NIES-68]GJP43508.1 hypothetical protein CLOM_g2960 [Closterium sp. NIES-68]GJP73447.1 hypothetical protein CLOP_g4158 [Closterium sp. NIES-67]